MCQQFYFNIKKIQKYLKSKIFKSLYYNIYFYGKERVVFSFVLKSTYKHDCWFSKFKTYWHSGLDMMDFHEKKCLKQKVRLRWHRSLWYLHTTLFLYWLRWHRFKKTWPLANCWTGSSWRSLQRSLGLGFSVKVVYYSTVKSWHDILGMVPICFRAVTLSRLFLWTSQRWNDAPFRRSLIHQGRGK